MTPPVNQLYTYALIKALYDEGRDYIDAFWPLVLQVLPASGGLGVTELQEALARSYGLRIPRHAIDTVLDRAVKRRLISREERQVFLTRAGSRHLGSLESTRDAERRINGLVDEAHRFLVERFQLAVTKENILAMLQEVFAANIRLFSAFTSELAPDPVRLTREGNHPHESALIEFLIEVERSRPESFSILRDLAFGSVVSASIYTRSFQGAGSTRPFRKTNVYLDTNLALSVLALDHAEANVAARELMDLMGSAGAFKVYVFDFTVTEMIRHLRGFSRERRSLVAHVRVGGVHSSLVSRGWRDTDVEEYIAQLDEHLAEAGVSILTTGIDLRDFTPRDPRALSGLLAYKPEQRDLGQNHDLAAVEHVARLRAARVRQIEEAREIFISADLKLSRYCFIERGHRENGTVAEVVPDRLLTNILWLKSPGLSAAPPLGSIIALHSRDLLIDRRVWQRFHAILTGLTASGRVDRAEASMLVYNRQVQELLREIEPDEAARVDEGMVLEALEDVHDRIEKDKEIALLHQHQELVATADQERQVLEEVRLNEAHDAAQERDRILGEHLDAQRRLQTRLLGAHDRLRRWAGRVASILTWAGYCTGLALAGYAGFRCAPWVEVNWSWLEPYSFAYGPAWAFVLGLGLELTRVRGRVRRSLAERLYRWRSSELSLIE